MKRVVVLVMGALAVVVSGCASNPKQTLGTLNDQDPKYASEPCLRARDLALQYNDKVISRVGTGMALGLLGPFGLIPAVMMDANQNSERKAMNDEMMRRCQTADGQVAPAVQKVSAIDGPGVSPETAPPRPQVGVPVGVKAANGMFSYGMEFGDAAVAADGKHFTIYIHPKAATLMIQPKMSDIIGAPKWPDQIWANAAKTLIEPAGCEVTQIAPISRSGGTWEASYACPPDVDLRAIFKAQHETLKRGEPLHP